MRKNNDTISVSIYGKNVCGRCFNRNGHITIYVNTLQNPEDDFYGFIAEFVAVEFHEMGHRYDGLSPCTGWYQELTSRVFNFIRKNLIMHKYKYSKKNIVNAVISGRK